MARRSAVSLLTAAIAVTSFVSVSARASASQEQDFVDRINAERTSRGIPSVVGKVDLANVARDWSGRMAAAGEISHDPNLPSKVDGWTVLGDCVGKGPTVDALHKAFMNSTVHRDVILNPDFNQIGVGIVTRDGMIYVTQIFARRSASWGIPIPKAPAKPKAKPKPAPVAPPQQAVHVAATGLIWRLGPKTTARTVDVLMELVALDAPQVDFSSVVLG